MNKDLLVSALQYKKWADSRTLDAIHDLPTSYDRKPLSFMLQQLNHMVIVEELFRARLLNLNPPHQATNTIDVPTLLELAKRIQDSNAWLTIYLQSLNSEDLSQVVRFRFADGKDGALTKAEILFHLVNHGTYHRGAIGHALDLSGGQRPADTFTVFIHSAEPHRRSGVMKS
jgi:uncharacterized damage-inducible protein DinB